MNPWLGFAVTTWTLYWVLYWLKNKEQGIAHSTVMYPFLELQRGDLIEIHLADGGSLISDVTLLFPAVDDYNALDNFRRCAHSGGVYHKIHLEWNVCYLRSALCQLPDVDYPANLRSNELYFYRYMAADTDVTAVTRISKIRNSRIADLIPTDSFDLFNLDLLRLWVKPNTTFLRDEIAQCVVSADGWFLNIAEIVERVGDGFAELPHLRKHKTALSGLHTLQFRKGVNRDIYRYYLNDPIRRVLATARTFPRHAYPELTNVIVSVYQKHMADLLKDPFWSHRTWPQICYH